MLKTMSAILLIFLTVISSFAQELKLTLDECVKLAIRSSDEIKISASRVKESEARVSEFGSQMLPQLKLSAGYTRMSSVDPFLVKVEFAPSPVKIADAVLDHYNFRLSLTQVLFSGFRLDALKSSARFAAEISEVEYDESKNNAANDALTGFWTLFKAMLGKQIAEQSVMQTERRISETKNFLASGLATSTDLLRLEVQNSNAKLQLLESENNINNARISLNRILGYSAETLTVPDTSMVLPEDVLEPEEYYVKYALTNRNEIRALELGISSSQQNVRVASSTYYPYVTLFGNFYYSSPNQRIQPPSSEFNATWDLGIGLTWDLWSWGYTSSLTEQARQIEQQNISRLELAKKKTEQEVRQRYSNADYQRKRVEASLLSVQLAERSYEEVVKKYDVQLSTSTEVADAETSLFIARRNHAFATIDFRIAVIALKKSCGILLY